MGKKNRTRSNKQNTSYAMEKIIDEKLLAHEIVKAYEEAERYRNAEKEKQDHALYNKRKEKQLAVKGIAKGLIREGIAEKDKEQTGERHHGGEHGVQCNCAPDAQIQPNGLLLHDGSPFFFDRFQYITCFQKVNAARIARSPSAPAEGRHGSSSKKRRR